jgi:hypothetical protein
MAFSKAFLQMIGEYKKPIKKEIKENKKETDQDRRERIKQDNANIQRIDNQIKR